MAKIEDIAPEFLQFTEAEAPSTPASGVVRIYAKTDGLLYSKDDAGIEKCLGATVTVVNDLTTGGTTSALSAEQGKTLKGYIDDLMYPDIVAVSTDKTLALTDACTVQEVTAEATITVPPNSSVAFPTGTEIVILSYTASTVDVAKGSGVSVNSKDAKLVIDGQYAAATLKKMGTDEWVLIGALA
jgi:hypothetical protein